MALPFVAAPPPGGGTSSGGTITSSSSSVRGGNTYRWVLGWIILIGLLALANQTETGHTILYYTLVLVLVFLLVTQYQFIASALAPIGQKAPATD